MKHVYDKGFVYTPAAQTSVDYLKERFAQIRQEIEANRKEAEAKVSTFKPKLRAKA
jgi:hypothetical protein